jgi:hypothetical protein
MSLERHAVTFSDNFIGFGAFPIFTHAHHVELDTGIIGGIGGVVLVLPMI